MSFLLSDFDFDEDKKKFVKILKVDVFKFKGLKIKEDDFSSEDEFFLSEDEKKVK